MANFVLKADFMAKYVSLSIFPISEVQKKKALYLSVNVFSTKELIGDTIFMSPTGDRTAILLGRPSHAKV